MGGSNGVRKTILPNRVRVLTEAIPQFSSATLGIWVQNGSRFERAEQNGISHFLEHLLFKGTERRSARQIAEEIDAVGGSLNAFTGREVTCYHAKVLAEHLPLAVDVLTDILLHSTFPEAEVERERTVILSEISEVEDSPDQHVHVLFDEHFWPGDSLARPIAGTRETVSALKRDDFVHFIGERYRTDRLTIAAAGAVDHDWLVERISEAFAGRDGVSDPVSLGEPRAKLALTIHDKALEQVQMLLGVPGMSAVDERRYAAFVLNTALGEGMSSRLFQEVRERRGKAYSIYSFLDSFSNAGYLAIYAALGGDSVAEVIELVRDELKSLRMRGLLADELERAKNQIKGGMLLGLESTAARMRRLALNEIYFGRHIEPAEVAERISAVTAEAVVEVAADLFGAERLAATLLGALDGTKLEESTLSLS